MAKNNPADPRLVQIYGLARRLREAKTNLYAELEAQVQARLQQHEDALNQAIVSARYEGLTVSAIARAYTGPGKTPNRNKITEILRDRIDPSAIPSTDSVFSWQERTVSTPEGERSVYDLVVNAIDYGPDDLTGRFRFRVLGTDIEPYSEDDAGWSDYDGLRLWMADNPRPS